MLEHINKICKNVFQKGFYDIEHDGVHKFAWMQKHGGLFLDDGIQAIKLVVGYPAGQKCQTLIIGNKKKVLLDSGWHTICVDLKDVDMYNGILELHCLEEIEKEMKQDARELCLMVCTPIAIKVIDYYDKRYFYTKYDDIEIMFLYSSNGRTEGILDICDVDKFDKEIFLDFLLNVTSNEHKLITFKFFVENKEYMINAQTTANDKTMLSIELPCITGRVYFEVDAQVFFDKAVIRDDYYDYFRTNKYATAKTVTNRQECVKAGNKLPFSLYWFVTYACNYHCHYCWEENNAEIYRKQLGKLNLIPPNKWADAINKLHPDYVYLSGGEPTLYKYLADVLELVDPDVKFTMYSNGGESFDIKRYIDLLKKDKFVNIFFSFHPSEITINSFLQKMDRCYIAMQDTSCVMCIELVLYPTDFKYAYLLLQYVDKKKILLRFDSWHDEKAQGKYTEDEEIIVATLRDKAFKHNNSLNILNIPYNLQGNVENSIKNHNPVFCVAGMKQLHMDSHGELFPCMSSMHRCKTLGQNSMPHYGSIGNIFYDGDNRLKSPIQCWEAFRCSECDYSLLGSAMRYCSLENDDYGLYIPE